jgi:hypothetical protein
MCFGSDNAVLYVATWAPQYAGEEGAPASVLVVDCDTLETLQRVDLRDCVTPTSIAFWEKRRALICLSDSSIVNMIPIGDDCRLLAPQRIVDVSHLTVSLGSYLAIDEDRSLAYCAGADPALRRAIYVVDLEAQEILGHVCIPGGYWLDPHPALSPTTDELWVATNSEDRISIFKTEDIIKRARVAAEGTTGDERPKRPRGG